MAGETASELGRQPEREERRRPLGEDDVLEKVRDQKLELQIVERTDERGERQDRARHERRQTAAAPAHAGYPRACAAPVV
jgi:hypothetical protein